MMRLLLLLVCLQATIVWCYNLREKRVGCENNPCNHECIDTVDSYYCTCFKNWVLQADGHTCVHERKTATDSLYIGCFAEKSEDRDFPFKMWTRTDASIEECVHSCRAQGFRYGAMQSGSDCYCAKSHYRKHNTSTACNTPCTGSPGQICGGDLANSVFKVTRDDRYMGCYNENPSSPDLGQVAWERDTVASVDDCVVYCSENDYLFAGVFNGGRCTCGNDYGRYGLAGEAMCSTVRCVHGWKEQNCGGNTTNAVYRVIKGQYFGARTVDVGKYATITADTVSDFPHQQGMYLQRFAMYASDVVHAPFEDTSCFTSNCYEPCDEIAKPDGFDRYRTDVVVRAYHIYLQDLHGKIDYNYPPQRVWLHAQTVVINQNTEFNFSLSIRARQIIIDYEINPTITFNHEGPVLGLDIEQAIHKGTPSDLTFQKQAWLCSRILMARPESEDNYRRVGWAIFDDLARERHFDVEQKEWLDGIRAMKIDYTGSMREGVRFQPYLSKAALEDRLEVYYQKIGEYDAKFNELLDDAADCNTFKSRAESLLTIWSDSMLAQANIIWQMARDSLTQSEETYHRMYAEYNESREELEVARQAFEDGIREWQQQQARRAMFGFIVDCGKIVYGLFPVEPNQTAWDIFQAGQDVTEDVLDSWEECSEAISASMEAMEEMLAMLDAMMAGVEGNDVDWSQYEGSVEEVAGLYATIEEWEVLMYSVDVILDDPSFRSISGCLGYQMAMFDTCNWGQALTKAAIELSENMRRAITAEALKNNKEEMDARIDAEIEALGTECAERDQMVITFAEQHYDIVVDANDALIIFCQAHFYETFQTCPENTLPKFAGDLSYLRSAINSAYLATSLYGRQSSGNAPIEIVDDPNAIPECKDWKVCPIKMFKENRELIVNVSIDHRKFVGIDLFLVQEIQAFINGAKSSTDNKDFRMLVDVSGPFQQKVNEQIESFITRPMAEMNYEYNIETRHISFHCDLYKDNGESGSNIQHMTPYVTWHFRIPPEWDNIILDDVTDVELVFIGPYLNRFEEEEEAE